MVEQRGLVQSRSLFFFLLDPSMRYHMLGTLECERKFNLPLPTRGPSINSKFF